MDDGAFMVLVIAALAAGAGGLALWSQAATRRRFEEYAQGRGWSYIRSDAALVKELPLLHPFGQGGSRRATNILHFTEGGRAGYSFEYSYTQRSADQERTRTYRYHVVVLTLPHPLPRLELRPERMFDGIAKMLGTQDVQFESAEFNRAWLVQSEHLPAAHDVIDPRMMQWLLEPAHRELRFVVQDSWLYTYVEGAQKVEQIDPLLGVLRGFLAQVPAFVWGKAQGEYPRPERRRGWLR